MKILPFAVAFLLSGMAYGNFSTLPKKCLSVDLALGQFCKVIAHEKSEYSRYKNKFYTSPRTVLEFDANSVFFGEGLVWFDLQNSIEIKTPFGSIFPQSSGQIWVEIKKDHALIRALTQDVHVLVRGESVRQVLTKGFEIKMSAVNYTTGRGYLSIPTSIRLEDHLVGLDRVFPYETMDFKQTVSDLARIVLEAAEEASRRNKNFTERKIASENERQRRLEQEAQLKSRLEMYFRRIYKQKNNFE